MAETLRSTAKPPARLVKITSPLARRLADAMRDEPGVEVLNDVVLNQVLLRVDDDDATTRNVVEEVQRGGEAWLGGTVWRGRAAIRVSVSNWSTTEDDVDRLVGIAGFSPGKARQLKVSAAQAMHTLTSGAAPMAEKPLSEREARDAQQYDELHARGPGGDAPAAPVEESA